MCRFLSDAVFEKFQDDLTNLFSKIRKEKELNIDADFWDLQLRDKIQ